MIVLADIGFFDHGEEWSGKVEKTVPNNCLWKDQGGASMTSIHAKVLSSEKFREQYRLIIELPPSEFLGPFESLRFKKNPYCGSFGTSIAKSWLTLDYRKDPGFKPGEAFPL